MAARVMQGFLLDIEHRPGSLEVVTARLTEAGVNIQGIGGMAFGARATIGLVTENTLATRDVLREVGVNVRPIEYFAVATQDKPGELHKHLTSLSRAGLNVVGLFPLVSAEPTLAFAVDDTKRARDVLRSL